jgi:phage/plasmid-associated DNA primase
LFYDRFGRAGKGTMAQFLTQLVPRPFITAVSPFNWDKEYYLASLIGSRFNSVGELPDSKPIPAASFKTVPGGDLLTGRHPNQRTVTFKNEAAHLFMSNHLINTQDHSEAFFTRWLIVEFPNSRLRTGLPIDPGLAERIIESELPGIAYWALTGAMRLMKNDSFSKSIVHDRLMEKWRRSTNSLEEFIFECCELVDQKEYIRRSDFYREYKEWCNENGRKPFAKGRVLDLITHNFGLGITHTKLDGNEIFRGVKMKSDDRFPDLKM